MKRCDSQNDPWANPMQNRNEESVAPRSDAAHQLSLVRHATVSTPCNAYNHHAPILNFAQSRLDGFWRMNRMRPSRRAALLNHFSDRPKPLHNSSSLPLAKSLCFDPTGTDRFARTNDPHASYIHPRCDACQSATALLVGEFRRLWRHCRRECERGQSHL